MITFLTSVPAFREFTPAEISVLSRVMSVEKYPDGHTFIREGASSASTDAMYLVVEGKVLLTRSGADQGGLVKLFDRGEIFGVVALLHPGVHSATCRAAGEVTVASLGRAGFDHLLHSASEVACKFQLVVARQLVRDHAFVQDSLVDAIENQDPARVLSANEPH